MRRFSGTAAARASSACWIASAALTAAVASSNTASTESPAMSMTRPWADSICVRKSLRAASSAATVAASSSAIRRE